ncbi:23S rRNA pseudouridine1911/1915/1917 synthase [Desulfacinum hydrothermale DSM 13146]|uniref:23S rRNA pseudouridine1911/1915/1917 synthase n=2 Tax=Desulfacinum hydrothermale TaxID=109258 RepID=A0A1W1XJG3_9BACT|nr:23S rRNA pseudouridine1911/1915/1917 synthase [Desulfacinum hydrothermale DSM 13146]
MPMTTIWSDGSRAKAFQEVQVPAHLNGRTLGALLEQICLLSPEEAEDLLDFGSVHVDGRRQTRSDFLLAKGSRVRIYWPWQGTARTYELDPKRLLYRDRWILAYNKEAGIPSQATPADAYNNLYAAVLRYLAAERHPAYAALHQRLDRDTTGVILLAVHKKANPGLGAAFQARRVKKIYLAWVAGSPFRDHWVTDRDIGRGKGAYRVCARHSGRPARTAFRVLFRDQDRALVEARPLTGRTHQIRLHLSSEGHPIVGDRLYGGDSAPARAEPLRLHAYRLELEHPVTRQPLRLKAPVPQDWPPVPPGTIPD